jgi:hypothetical protein
VPNRLPPPAGPTRYSYEKVIGHLEAFLTRAPRGMRKRLAASAGIDHPGFSHRMTGRAGMRFSIEQLGAMAAEVDAPDGWPFLSWEDAETVRAVKTLVANVARRT